MTHVGQALAMPAEPIVLRRAGQYVDIFPAVAGLERCFYYADHVPISDPRLGHRAVPAALPLIWEGEDLLGRLHAQCFAGLEPLVQELLVRSGCEVRLKGKRPKPLPPPDLHEVDTIGRVDVGVLDFVRTHDRGLIRIHPQGRVRVARLIAQIARAWPKLRIIVVTTRIDDARRLRRHLARYLPQVTLFSSRHHTARAGRIAVATYSMLADGTIAIERRHIYIAVNPTELINGKECSDWGIAGIRLLHRARLYGVLGEDVRLAPRLRDLVTALFGVAEVKVPRHGYRPLPVDVVFSPIEGGNRPPIHKDDALVKRLGIHGHQVRNRRIVRLAQALANKDIGGSIPEKG
jgi:hypothetical protein